MHTNKVILTGTVQGRRTRRAGILSFTIVTKHYPEDGPEGPVRISAIVNAQIGPS